MTKKIAVVAAAALADLRKRDDVKWTYISPAGDFQAEGERTGEYIDLLESHGVRPVA